MRQNITKQAKRNDKISHSNWKASKLPRVGRATTVSGNEFQVEATEEQMTSGYEKNYVMREFLPYAKSNCMMYIWVRISFLNSE